MICFCSVVICVFTDGALELDELEELDGELLPDLLEVLDAVLAVDPAWALVVLLVLAVFPVDAVAALFAAVDAASCFCSAFSFACAGMICLMMPCALAWSAFAVFCSWACALAAAPCARGLPAF